MSKKLDFLLSIVKEAEKISREQFIVEDKYGAENDLVTNLDTKIESFLISKIKESYPEFDIVSEEFNSKKEITKNCFVIDPIDGTINFANNLPLWGIQICCVEGGKRVAAVIDLVRQNELFYADETGAYLNGRKIHARSNELGKSLYSIDGSNNIPAYQKMRKYSSQRRNFGAVCVSCANVAAGRIQACVYRSDKPWDYEPGLFICQMAGAYTKNVSGFHCAAANKELLDILYLETAKNLSDSNLFVLHSLNADTIQFWGVDVKTRIAENGTDVFMPEFPIRAESSFEAFEERLLPYLENGTLNKNSIVVAHSIGNPYFIRFCAKYKFSPKLYIAVAPRAIYGSSYGRTDYMVKINTKSKLEKSELLYIKKNVKVICLYSDEEMGEMQEFDWFERDTGAKKVYLKGYNHFDGAHRIYQIPELVELIKNNLWEKLWKSY